MSHPYADLPAAAFWRSAVVETAAEALRDLVIPKFRLDAQSAIATAGSCFAQHIGQALRGAGLHVLDAEPAPPKCPPQVARAYGYGVYSARYGNIYSSRQLVQLLQDVVGDVVDPAAIWPQGARFHDALRPTIEPDGFASVAEALALRRAHLAKVRALFTRASHFVFTLGLTECWADRDSGRVYPTCPGVVAGAFDPARHQFLNLGWPEVMADLTAVRALLRGLNPDLRMILTVSPVPLIATASGRHVLQASVGSKAILRAAAGAFAEAHADVDYFPSYEIVTNPAAAGRFFAANLREVTPEGVVAAMQAFLAAHGLTPQAKRSPVDGAKDAEPADVICEELLLEAFRK